VDWAITIMGEARRQKERARALAAAAAAGEAATPVQGRKRKKRMASIKRGGGFKQKDIAKNAQDIGNVGPTEELQGNMILTGEGNNSKSNEIGSL